MPPLAETIHEVRQAILQEQTAREKLIFALLHPTTGEGHHAVGHPVGQHLAELHKLVMAPELRDEGNLNGDTEAGRKLFKDAMHVGSSGDILVVRTGQHELRGDHGRYDPKTFILHLEHPDHAASPDDHTRTLVHELAHSYIVRANGNQWLQPDPASHANSGRDRDEVVAEGATYIVAKHYGLDTTEKSIGKIHMDSGPGHDVFHDPATLTLIRDTASAMLKDLDPIAKPTLPKIEAQHWDQEPTDANFEISNYAEEAFARIGIDFNDPEGDVEEELPATLEDVKNVRIQLRQENAEALSARTGGKLSVADAYQFQDQWSASPDATLSIILQKAVSDRFGLVPPQRWHSLSRGILGDPGISFDLGSVATSTTQKQWEEAARLFVDAQYAETQDYYKKLGITHVTLHRGISFERVDQVPGPLKRGHAERAKKYWAAMAELDKHRVVDHPTPWSTNPDLAPRGVARNIKMHPLSSFSLSHGVAVNFTVSDGISYVLSASVPVERIFGNGITGIGAATEGEHVLLGGPTDLAFSESWNL